MNLIIKLKYGSHLYGTQTLESDLDIKAIYIPSSNDILLQKVQPVISFTKPKVHGQKNTATDTDYEAYSPKKFFDLLLEGQTVALEMLFAPQNAMLIEPSIKWKIIKELAPQLFTKRAASFIRYCQQQANKYGIKGSRVAAARLALETLIKAHEQYGGDVKLLTARHMLDDLVKVNEFISIVEQDELNGKKSYYLDVCGKKASFNASIKSAQTIVQNLVNEYGERALQAELNQGIDWKALSHAVRVGYQAVEFLTTQHITFPRPEAHHLLNIKQGKLLFTDVAQEIEQLLVNVEEATLISSFPESCNTKIIDNFIKELYKEQIEKESS